MKILRWACQFTALFCCASTIWANEAEFREVEWEDIEFNASSQLTEPNKPRNAYAPENIYSGGAKKSWCEGVKGPGIGEFVELRFPPKKLSYGAGLRILNGFGGRKHLYFANNRVRKLGVQFLLENGSSVDVVLNLKDDTCGHDEVCKECISGYYEHYGPEQCKKAQNCANQCEVTDGYLSTGGEIFYFNYEGPLLNVKGILSPSQWSVLEKTPLIGVRLTILDIYKGKKHDDTCIADFRLIERM